MKAIALSIVMLAVTAAAQQTPPTAPAPPKATAPAPITVDPKHSEASATLRALEAEKDTLYQKRSALVDQANQILGGINNQINDKDKSEAEWIAKIKAENGWDESYEYVPLQATQDGKTVPGHWQHQPKK